ncbi:MAG: hypothetical protein JL50_09845 [Peptococcaceae bacterium BICA1-7]|nr:MAG: hypothetical protein JL50_09845 [Peptococcaceae bacterium BICA1-7]HBV95584.1 DUF4173 domain-containing protein [Desulfotomaculum sp.]
MDITEEQEREKQLLAVLSLILAVFFNYLFYSKQIGISYFVYTVSFLALFYWYRNFDLDFKTPFGWYMVIPALLLSSAFFIHSNPVLTIINLFAIPVLITWHTLLVTGCSLASAYPSLIGIIIRKMIIALTNFCEPYKMLIKCFKKSKSDSRRETNKKIFIGLLVSTPILIIVVSLLSSADMVFSYYLSNISKITDHINLSRAISRLILILIVFSYTFGFLWSFNLKRSIDPSSPRENFDPVIFITVLVVLNIVYTLFSLIQFSYLYGGQDNSLPASFTYAQYARKGFFELVAVTIINLSIFLAGIRHTRYDNKTTDTLMKVFLSLLIMFTINMLFSAHFKMSLYEDAYGLTYLRVFVHAFILLLFLLLAVGLIKIWRRDIPLVKLYIAIAVTFYTALNFINVDRLIIKSNIQLYQKTGHIDMDYLSGLSYDAVPELTQFLRQNPGLSDTGYEPVDDTLARKYDELQKQSLHWQSFNYSKLKARQGLESYLGLTGTS